MAADGRLAVLLAHLAPSQHPPSLQPGSRSEVAWTNPANGQLLIVGGICLDIQAQPSTVDIQRGTSVPGQVRQVPGGVGRNMAEALSRLLPLDRAAPMFVSLVGDDPAGAFLAASLRKLRLDLSQLMTCFGSTTPCVSAVLDRGGEVAACVADVRSVEAHLTPEALSECASHLQQASLVLAEANLSPEALQYVARTASLARVPVFLEPVSVPKAARLAGCLPYATFISPNAAELVSLADEVRRTAGMPVLPRPALPEEGEEGGGGAVRQLAAEEPVVALLRQLAPFAEVVLMQGTYCVVLTLGSLGAALITLSDAEAAAAAVPPTPTPPSLAVLSPLNASSTCLTASAPSDRYDSRAEACSLVVAQTAASASCRAQCATHTTAPLRRMCRTLSRADTSSSSPLPTPTPSLDPTLLDPIPSAPSYTTPSMPVTSPPLPMTSSSQWTSADRAADVTHGPPPPVAAAVPPLGCQAAALLQVVHLRALPAEVVSVNGAGDTLVAAMVAALLQQQTPERALAYGMAAARRAVESHRNVPDLEFAALRSDADRVMASLQRYFFPTTTSSGTSSSGST